MFVSQENGVPERGRDPPKAGGRKRGLPGRGHSSRRGSKAGPEEGARIQSEPHPPGDDPVPSPGPNAATRGPDDGQRAQDVSWTDEGTEAWCREVTSPQAAHLRSGQGSGGRGSRWEAPGSGGREAASLPPGPRGGDARAGDEEPSSANMSSANGDS